MTYTIKTKNSTIKVGDIGEGDNNEIEKAFFESREEIVEHIMLLLKKCYLTNISQDNRNSILSNGNFLITFLSNIYIRLLHALFENTGDSLEFHEEFNNGITQILTSMKVSQTSTETMN
jgi:hypothetical protein